jgi:hypothetical protein
MKNIYNIKSVGCYVDGAHGIHSFGMIIEFAKRNGFSPKSYCSKSFIDEIKVCLDAIEYMNKNFPVKKACWNFSWHGNGDFGLYKIRRL